MEDIAPGTKFLAWKQKAHVLAAVDRFNVVSFWSTLSGKLIHKQLLDQKSRIPDAYYYRSYSSQRRYQDPANQFDVLPQAIISHKRSPGGLYSMKLVQL